jgi:hypothetical protein
MIFWTTNYGKDIWVYLGAILVLSSALAIYSKGSRLISWEVTAILGGLLLISVLKPYITLALIAGLLFQAGFGRTRQWYRVPLGRQILKISGLIIIAWIAFRLERNLLGGSAGQSLLQQVSQKADLLSSGGSAISLGSASSVAGVVARTPFSLLATFFRPSVFDAHSVFTWVVTLEVAAFWIGCVFTTYRIRQSGFDSETGRGAHQMGRVGLIALLILGTALAPVLGNLGTLARVRVFDYPYLAFLPCYFAGLRSAKARVAARSRIPLTAAHQTSHQGADL